MVDHELFHESPQQFFCKSHNKLNIYNIRICFMTQKPASSEQL